MLVTQVAAATGALGWLFVEWLLRGRVSLLGACSGAVAGLVAITRNEFRGKSDYLFLQRDFFESSGY